jgi:hypothetical protein
MLLASIDIIRSASKRFGAPWLARAATEFVRTLPAMPAYVAPIKQKGKYRKAKPDMGHSRRLRVLDYMETEILAIARAVDAIREATAGDSEEADLATIKEEKTASHTTTTPSVADLPA